MRVAASVLLAVLVYEMPRFPPSTPSSRKSQALRREKELWKHERGTPPIDRASENEGAQIRTEHQRSSLLVRTRSRCCPEARSARDQTGAALQISHPQQYPTSLPAPRIVVPTAIVI